MPQPYEQNVQDWTGDGAAKTITFGFSPRSIHIINLTDRIEHFKTSDMVNSNCLKRIANGTGTFETVNGIVLQDKTAIFNATDNVNMSLFYVVAFA